MNSLHSRSANSSGTSTVMDAAMAAMAPPSISTRSRTSTGEPLGGVSPLCRFLTTGAGAAISQIFAAPDGTEARRRLHAVVATLERSAAKVALLLEAAEEDLLAHMAFPAEHWSKLRSTNPLERLSREIGRRSDVVGIYPNDAALIRLAGALLLEQNEWLIGRRYLSVESLSRLYEMLGPEPQERRVVPVQATRKEIALASP